jgi:hypothetical protein
MDKQLESYKAKYSEICKPIEILTRLNILFIGSKNVGKSSFIRTFMGIPKSKLPILSPMTPKISPLIHKKRENVKEANTKNLECYKVDDFVYCIDTQGIDPNTLSLSEFDAILEGKVQFNTPFSELKKRIGDAQADRQVRLVIFLFSPLDTQHDFNDRISLYNRAKEKRITCQFAISQLDTQIEGFTLKDSGDCINYALETKGFKEAINYFNPFEKENESMHVVFNCKKNSDLHPNHAHSIVSFFESCSQKLLYDLLGTGNNKSGYDYFRNEQGMTILFDGN